MIEKLRGRIARNPQRRLIEATRVLAHDPGDCDAMAEVMTSANDAGFVEVAKWMWGIIQKAQRDARDG